jgi:hypothetical protein
LGVNPNLATKRRSRRTVALVVLSALLLLCFGLPCPRAEVSQYAHAGMMHDCADVPGKSQLPADNPAQCLLGYSIPSLAPNSIVSRVAYLAPLRLLLADNTPDSAIIEPPLPPPRPA